MNINFRERGIVELNDARIIFRNFAGKGDKFNREGDRNFCVIIPNREIADALINDTNEYGLGWNVQIKDPREEGDDPFMYLKVKVKYKDNDGGGRRGPSVFLKTGTKMNKLDEDSIHMLDDIDISSVSMDIRPYDDVVNGKPFRAAYLVSICVTQNIDRFSAMYAEQESPEE